MREKWIDRWRGTLIILIVLFHVIGAIAPAADESEALLLRHISAFIERFHVASFFVLAGVTFHSGKPWRSFVCGKMRRLLVPYFCFGMLWAVLYVLSACCFTGWYDQTCSIGVVKPFVSIVLCNGWPDGIGRRVVSVLWFLPCMFLTEVLYYLISRVVPDAVRQLLLLPLCYAVTQCMHGMSWCWEAQLVPKFLVFMILGRMFVPVGEIRIKRADRLVKCVCGLFALGLVWQQGVLRQLCDACGLLGWIGFVNGILGAMGCALLAQGVNLSCLVKIGRYTLGILVIHKVWILLFQIFGTRIMQGVNLYVVGVALTCVVCFASIVAAIGIVRIAPWVLGERKDNVRTK